MNDRLALTEIAGTPRQCGEEYGRRFGQRIMGFCQQEVKPDRSRLKYAERCWKHIERDGPASAQFLKGMAAGANLSLPHVTLLSLHEEIYHMPHCTAFVATGEATRGGKTINGQNWDWAPSLFDWPGLLRMRAKGGRETLTYHYPGLWMCAGVNDAGLSLMWTGSGYFPQLKPRVGMPTYVLIAEILGKRSVDEAVGYLKSVKHAGSFIFFLGDAAGNAAVAEGMPGPLEVERAERWATRANHYVCDELVSCSQQKVPRHRKQTTRPRASRMAELVRQAEGKLTIAIAKKILIDRDGEWPWLHQFPGGGEHAVTLGGMTVDSLIAESGDRVLHTCRGGRTPGAWQSASI